MFTPNWIDAVVPPYLLKQATQKGMFKKMYHYSKVPV